MKTIIQVFAFLSFSAFGYAQNTESKWAIYTDSVYAANYYGVTVANGVLGLVSSSEPLKVKEIILNGAYDNYGRGRVSNIMKTFNFMDVTLEVDGLPLGRNEIKNYSQSLDMHEASFITSFDHTDKVSVHSTLRALRHLPHTALMDITLTAKKDITFTVYNILSSPDVLRDVKNYYQLIDRPHALIPLLTSVATSPSGKLTIAASTSFIFPDVRGMEPSIIHEDWDYNMHRMKFTQHLKVGETYTFSLVGSTISTAHIADPHNEAERLTLFAALEKSDRLVVRHIKEWQALWKSDIILTGDDAAQRTIHLALYNLYSFTRAGTAYSLSPMGLSGTGYNGHVFWDTELWMFPPLLLLHPELAKSLLEYRFARLDEAKRNAFNHGYRGAMFPWESDDNGQESTPVWALTGPFQHHITGDIGFAFWQYYLVTKDKEWLATRGYPLLKEVADFWISRVERDEDNRYHIRNVVAADEFAENVNDDAFTNGMAKEVLYFATRAALELKIKPNPEWSEVSKNIVILQFSDGVTKEHESYGGEIIKQSDVNLLAYPMSIVSDTARILADLHYYETRMHAYGPAMGKAILSLLYERTGNTEKAYALFKESYQLNTLPPFGVLAETAGGTNPYFVTGGGGILQTMLNGFGGLAITDHGVIQRKTNLPKGWKSLHISGIGLDHKTFMVK